MRWRAAVLAGGWLMCSMVAVAGSAVETYSPPTAETTAGDLIQTLETGTCPKKNDAIRQYLGAPGDRLGALRRELATQRRSDAWVGSILAFLTEDDGLAERIEKEWPRKFAQAAKLPDPLARAAALAAAGNDLYAIAADQQEPFFLRLVAARTHAFFAARIDRALDPPWTHAIPRMLESQESRTRLIGALVAAEGRLRKEQAIEKGKLIPELIAGLRGSSFAERYYSGEALIDLTALGSEQLCVDPSSPPDPQAIVAWEQWWAANRSAMEHQAVPGQW